MAEERVVTQDEHRADLSERRGTLKEEVAGRRQEVSVLAKTMDRGFAGLQQAVTQMRADMEQALRDFGTRLDR